MTDQILNRRSEQNKRQIRNVINASKIGASLIVIPGGPEPLWGVDGTALRDI